MIIRASTPALIPLKAYCMIFMLWNSLSTKDIIRIIQVGWYSQTPSVANSAPQKPQIRKPTKVAALIAIGPGVDSEIATISRISLSVIQCFFSTISFESVVT